MTALFDSGVWINLSPTEQDKLWQHCVTRNQDPVLRWHRYIDQLCIKGVLPWLQDLLQIQQPIHIVSGANDGPAADSHPVTRRTNARGTSPQHRPSLVLDADNLRFVVAPSEAIDFSELRVPAAWVNDPHQAGDYYLAVRVDPDEGNVHIWGYVSHPTLAQAKHYDPKHLSYSVPQEAIITDLAILAVTYQLGMAHANAHQQTTAAMMGDECTPETSIPATSTPEPSGTPTLHPMGNRIRQTLDQGIAALDIRQWLNPNRHQNLQAQGWELLDQLLPPASEQALAFRWTSWANDGDGQYSRGKRITFNQLDNHHLYLFLLVRVAAEEDGRLAIRVQLRPETLEATLLDGVCLALVSPAGDVIQAVHGRAVDSYIQLKRFRLPQGTNFGIQVELNDAVVTEAFRIGQSNY